MTKIKIDHPIQCWQLQGDTWVQVLTYDVEHEAPCRAKTHIRIDITTLLEEMLR